MKDQDKLQHEYNLMQNGVLSQENFIQRVLDITNIIPSQFPETEGPKIEYVDPMPDFDNWSAGAICLDEVPSLKNMPLGINFHPAQVNTSVNKQPSRYFGGIDPVELDAESGSTTLTVKDFLKEVSELPSALVQAALGDPDEEDNGERVERILDGIRSQGLEEAVQIEKPHVSYIWSDEKSKRSYDKFVQAQALGIMQSIPVDQQQKVLMDEFSRKMETSLLFGKSLSGMSLGVQMAQDPTQIIVGSPGGNP